MKFSDFFEIYTNVLIADFLRYFIAATLAYLIFWILLKKTLTHRIIQQKFPTAKKMWFEFRYSMSTVAIFALIGSGIFLAKKAGYTQIYENVGDYGWLYFVGSFVLIILIHDTYFYFAHRLMHHPTIFKHVHLVHHKSTNPSPWAAYSFHPLEAIVEAGIFPLIIFMLPIHGIVLVMFLIFMISRNVLGHLGMEIFPKGFMKNKLLNWNTTTTHHDLHHKNFHSNYGLYFTWWDDIFETTDEKYVETFEEVTAREKRNVFSEKALKVVQRVPIIIGLIQLCFTTNLMAQSPIGLWQTFHEETGKPLSLIEIKATENGLVVIQVNSVG